MTTTDYTQGNVDAADAYLRLLGFLPADPVDGRLILSFTGSDKFVMYEAEMGYARLYRGCFREPTMGLVAKVRLTALPGPFMRRLRRYLEDAIDDTRRASESGGQEAAARTP